MIDESHAYLLRWADWVLSPVGMDNLGYGKTIELRILEGRGTLMPGGSGRARVVSDPMAQKVEEWMGGLLSGEVKLLKVFYLSRYLSKEDKAAKLRIPERTMYDRLDKLHVRLLSHLTR